MAAQEASIKGFCSTKCQAYFLFQSEVDHFTAHAEKRQSVTALQGVVSHAKCHFEKCSVLGKTAPKK